MWLNALSACCAANLHLLKHAELRVYEGQVAQWVTMPCFYLLRAKASATIKVTVCISCRLATERKDVPFLLLDVEASPTNRALAMEKALTKPQSQRRTAKPVLRGKLHVFSVVLYIMAYP